MSQQEPEHDDRINAHFPAPDRSVLRLRDHGTPEEPACSVEVIEATAMSDGRAKSDDATVVTLFEGEPLPATALYNQLVEPLIEEELDAALEIMHEAKEQGDTITYMNQKEYVKDLEEQLDD